MKRLIVTSATAALFATTALATQPEPGAILGTTLYDVQTALMAEDYALTKFERDDGRIEVVAVKEHVRLELYLDPVSGAVTSAQARTRGGYGAQAGLSTAEVLSVLTQQGYKVVGFERERGEMEIYAEKDGQMWELKVDPATGRVIQSEHES